MLKSGQSCSGPGYATPLDAMNHGPREKLMYVVCIQPNSDKNGKSDYLATIDVDPESQDYCKVISRLHTGYVGDELHHSGWNVCSSCHHDAHLKRDKLIMPSLNSDRIYFVDVGTNPKEPKMHKVIEASKMHAFDCSTPHTIHCTSTDIMISIMGDTKGNGKGDFILIDPNTLEIKGTWLKGSKKPSFGYDFWYQPYHDVMVSSEWGTPNVFKPGFNPADGTDKTKYGRTLNFYSWSKQELVQQFDLAEEGITPLEVRFHHNPKSSTGYVGCAFKSNVFRFFLKDGSWCVEKVIEVTPIEVTGWHDKYLPGMITDIILSLDDRYIYFSNWLQGDVRQYDISDPAHPKLVGQVYLGGKLTKNSSIQAVDPKIKDKINPDTIKGRTLEGGPQMLQLSLDGKRLYATSSLYTSWDKGIYPEAVKAGSYMIKIDVDTEKGGLKLDQNFLIDFGKEPDGPILAHEMRYPGGDCSSDIWLAEKCHQ